MVLGGAFLLFYNYIRFNNAFDFGYITINGASWIVSQAQKYGMFSPHFIPSNLYSMILAFPWKLLRQCQNYLPRGSGMNIIVTTPALVYIFRKFKFSWWTLGCWCAILLSVVTLAMYSNNGAVQYGYRYVLDFIVPVIMLIAFTAGEKISFPLKILIILSILVNYYGILSWYHGIC